uniref:Calcineurin-like phosphoesterase domain-containing protein n=1 Tax=Branchiostoma floridae TaxID=7739 RepID=C3Z7U4_BRAFL|eukprot:XP_002595437.1 hypothetical protein BRAFLDRAFT_69269 [Branchiostoma floridae]
MPYKAVRQVRSGAQVVEPGSPSHQVDPKVAAALVDLLLDYSELRPEEQVESLDDIEQKDLTDLVEITHPDFAPYDPEPSVDSPGVMDKLKAKVYMNKIRQYLESYAPKPADKQLVWCRDNSENSGYDRPVGNKEEEVVVVPMVITDSPKRQVVALSDCHLVGAKFSQATFDRLLKTMEGFAKDGNLHSLVLLGDMLEMWCHPHDGDAMTDQELVEAWQKDEPCQKFIQSLLLLINKGVHVYYVMGNHDHNVMPWMADKLGLVTRGDKFHLVRGVLVMEVKVDDQLYRVRFEHGHDEDIFNTYGGVAEEDLIGGEPLGYISSRTSSKRDGDPLPILEKKSAATVATYTLLGSQALHLLSSRSRSERAMRVILEHSLGRKMTDDDVVFCRNNQYLNLRKYSRFQLFKRVIDRARINFLSFI